MSGKWRTVRVFISSTFRDTQAERDYLVRFVFPQLREELLTHRIHLIDVDLRWGVTSEQNAREICQKVIDECRPHFICILGGRYGWTPSGQDRSITADEVHYAALDRPEEKWNRFFYFRDPRVTDSIPEVSARAVGYREYPAHDEIADYGLEQAEAMANERTRKLEALKQAVRQGGYPIHDYTPTWDERLQRLVHLEAFGKGVYADLLGSIILEDELGIEESVSLDEFAEENAAMEAFIAERAESYVLGSRANLLIEMKAFAESNNEPSVLALTGISGLGKSALLSWLLLDYRAARPDILVIPHFVGASPDSTDLRHILRRLCHELGAHDPLPEDIQELLKRFPLVLTEAAHSRRVLLVIDALNQMDGRDNAHALLWLPDPLPPNVRVIVAMSDHPVLDSVLHRVVYARVEELEPITDSDARTIISEFLMRYHKQMSEEQVLALLEKGEIGHPLYLLVALEELRTLGHYEEITARIRELPGETRSLFLWVLNRLSNDPDFRDIDGEPVSAELVRVFVSCLGVSRFGLSQMELIDLIAPGDPLGNVSALLRLLRPYLMRRGKLLDFFHNQFREAVQGEYLDAESERFAARLRLVNYFESHPINPRVVDELPYQLTAMKSWQKLYNLMANLPFLAAAWHRDQYELRAYWAKVEENSKFEMVNAYRNVLENPEEYADYVDELGILLFGAGHPQEAQSLFSFLIDHYRQMDNRKALSAAIGALGLTFQATGHWDRALELHREQAEVCRERNDIAGLQISMGNQAIILQQTGQLDKSLALHLEEEHISRILGDTDGVARSLSHQGMILETRGDPNAAMALYQESENLYRTTGNLPELAGNLSHQAHIYKQRAELDQAMILYVEAEQIFRSLGMPSGTQGCVGGRAEILQAIGKLDDALDLFKEKERISREINDRHSVSASLGNQAAILATRGELDSSLSLHKQVEIIFRELGDIDGLLCSLGNQGVILESKGDLKGALELHQQEDKLCRQLDAPARLAASLISQAILLRSLGDSMMSMKLLKESENICRLLSLPVDLSSCLSNQANILKDNGEFESALSLQHEVENLCKASSNLSGLQTCLGNQATILTIQGNLIEAMRLAKEQEQICRQVNLPNGLRISLLNQANILVARGEFQSALELYQDCEMICREIGYTEGLAIVLVNQALIFAQDMKMPDRAVPLLEESQYLIDKYGMKHLANRIDQIVLLVRRMRPILNELIPYEHLNILLSQLETELKTAATRRNPLSGLAKFLGRSSLSYALPVHSLRVTEVLGELVIAWSYFVLNNVDLDMEAATRLLNERIASLALHTAPGGLTSDDDGAVLIWWGIQPNSN